MKNKLIIFLTIITFLILGYPLIISGIMKTFYLNVDPDIVYMSNALLYTKSFVIVYADHPGTPMIMLLYYSFFPLRFIVKYIIHQNFIQWSFNNFAILTYYVRFLQLTLYSLATYLFLKLIKKVSKSNLLTIFTWMAILSFAGSSHSLIISPENFSYFLTVIWLIFFWKFIKKPSYWLNVLLVVISGFALANKFTCLFLLISSLAMPFFIKELNLIKKIIGLVFNIIISGLSFYIGILPAIMRLNWITQWVSTLFYHTKNYGEGKLAVFDWADYSTSVIDLIKVNWGLVIFVCAVVILSIYLLVKNKIKITNPVIFLFATAIAGIVVFAKYPLVRYSYVNITLLLFCSVYFLSKIKLSVIKIFLLFMTVIFIFNMVNYEKMIFNNMEDTSRNNIYSVLNIWTTQYMTGNLFREQLDAKGFTVTP